MESLDSFQDNVLETRRDLLTLFFGRTLTVQGQQRTQVELWLLQQLNLSDVDVLQWQDGLGGLFNFTANNLWNQLGGQLSQSDVRNFSLHDLNHLLSHFSQLGRLSVSGLLDLVGLSLGESNGEDSQNVVVSSLDGNVGFNQRLPLSDQGSQLVRSEVQTVEVGQQVLTLNFVNSQLDLSVRVVLRTLQVSQANFEDTALQTISSVLQTGRLVDQGLTDVSVLKGRRSLDVKPFLSGEWVDGLLLQTFLTLGQSLVLTNCHDVLY